MFLVESQINATANSSKRTVNATVNAQNATANSENLIKRLIEKATVRGEKLTANRISILRLMAENPYVIKEEMAAITSLNASTIMRDRHRPREHALERLVGQGLGVARPADRHRRGPADIAPPRVDQR